MSNPGNCHAALNWSTSGYAYNEEKLIRETEEIEGDRINPETGAGFMFRCWASGRGQERFDGVDFYDD